MHGLARLMVGALALGPWSVVASAFAEDAARPRVAPSSCDAADAAPCLQFAIDMAAQSGSDVAIPAGRYLLRGNITLRSGVNVVGEDGAVIAPSPDNVAEPMLVYADGAEDVTVTGVAFEGGGQDFANDKPLISLDGTKDVVFDHVIIRHARGKAMEIIASGNAHFSSGTGIQNSLLEDLGNHWKKTRKPEDRIVAVVFWDEDLTGTKGNFARGNRFSDIGLDALQITGQDGFVSDGNTFELENGQRDLVKAGDYPAAMFVTRSIRVTLRGNTVHGAVGNGIDAPGIVESVIEGNSISGCGQAGIGIFQNYDGDKSDSVSVTIRGNTIEDNVGWKKSIWRAGIVLGGGRPTDITIAGNTITDTRTGAKKTQDYGVDVVNGGGVKTKPKNLVVAKDNVLAGNRRSATHGI